MNFGQMASAAMWFAKIDAGTKRSLSASARPAITANKIRFNCSKNRQKLYCDALAVEPGLNTSGFDVCVRILDWHVSVVIPEINLLSVWTTDHFGDILLHCK